VSDDDLTLLAQAAANGDDRALRELVLATQAAVHRLCCHLANPRDAEDLTQDTYLRALQALPTYRGDAPVLVWLLGIARHVCVDHVRRRVRRAPIDRKVAAATHGPVHEPAMLDVVELLESLDEERYTAFVLTQVLGYSYEETAAICACPVGTIRSRVARARAHLVTAVRRADAV